MAMILPDTRDLLREWTLLVEPQMGPGPRVVTEIRSQGSLQMARVQDDEMVQAVSSYRADQAFGVGFCQGLRGAVSSSSMPNGRDPPRDVVVVDAIPIANEIPRRVPIEESFDDRLGRPGRGGMLGHIEMQHFGDDDVPAR
jgi:hypothetical protein